MKDNTRTTFTSYIYGFLLSILLTLTAYIVVVYHIFSANIALLCILVLAAIQLFVQLLFFLHLGKEKTPRWKLVLFLATASMVLVVVVASIWIMNHLNYNMTPTEMNQTILKSEGMQR